MRKSPLAEFGKRVRQRRKALGLSQADLGELAQIHVNFAGGIERGRNPSLMVICAVAGALQTQPEALVAGLALPPPPHAIEAVRIRQKRRAEREKERAELRRRRKGSRSGRR